MWQINTTSNLEQQNTKSLGVEEDKSAIKLNGEILEEVSTYEYLGEVIHNKGNLADHITDIEKKVRGATATILAETCNTEFKGIQMKAIWQMVDAIIIPIITYSCEGWTTNKEEIKKTTKYFQRSTKHHPLPTPRDPTTILLNRTGNIPIEYIIEYIIENKQILQAKRIEKWRKNPW